MESRQQGPPAKKAKLDEVSAANGDILVPADPGPPGTMTVKMERERENCPVSDANAPESISPELDVNAVNVELRKHHPGHAYPTLVSLLNIRGNTTTTTALITA